MGNCCGKEDVYAKAARELNEKRANYLRSQREQSDFAARQQQQRLEQKIQSGRPASDPGLSMIRSRLFLGSIYDALDLSVLQQHCITHIVNVTRTTYALPSADLTCLQINIDDDESEDIFKHFERSSDFVQQALDGNGAVLAHCEYGISRSATIVAAYLMKTENLGAASALGLVRDARRIVSPNQAFLVALVELDTKLRGVDGDSIDDVKKTIEN